MNMSAEFDQNIFTCHTMPLAGYLESEGYAEIAPKKKVNAADYERLVPTTTTIARAMFSALPQRDRWGRQVQGRTGGQWVTEVRGQWYPARNGSKRPGKSLTAHDLLRSLARPNVFAFGRTDAHVEEVEFPRFRAEEFHTTSVDCLCLDVDMDFAWERQDAGMIHHEIAREHEIARALGLFYRVFRTGSRGHQVVIPLPAAIDRSVATWLLYGFVSLLEQYHLRDTAENSNHLLAKADVSNLEKIIRIAGGRHIRTGRLALWIDPGTGHLHDLAQQSELMRRGYQHPGNGAFAREDYIEAAEEIAAYLESQMVFRHECPKMPFRTNMFHVVVKALPTNLLVERFLAAQDEWGLSATSARLSKVSTPKVDTTHVENQTDASEWQSAPEGIQQWATRVWAMQWGEGTFWSWVNEGGERAITAAKVLFGDQALRKLIERTYAAPHVTPEEPNEWRRVINALYHRHEMLGYKARLNPNTVFGHLSDEDVALIPMITDALNTHKKIQTRNREDIEHIIYILLLAFKQSVEGYIDLSQEAIRDSIRTRWPDADVDVSTIWRHLRRLKEGDSACGFSLLQSIRVDRSGQNYAARYRPGADLRKTPFGATLPVDACEDAPERTSGPLEMEVISRVTGKIETVDLSPKQRGRKPTQQYQEEHTVIR